MKKFRTVKVGITFFLDYDRTVEIIKKRRRSTEELTDRYCCIYLDGLGIDINQIIELANQGVVDAEYVEVMDKLLSRRELQDIINEIVNE